jgi:hypothetical protein
MMSVYAVMIKDAHGNRWVDSLWVNKFTWQHGADERAATLKAVFEAMNANHTPYVVEMKLEDGALAEGQPTGGASGTRTTPPNPQTSPIQTQESEPKAGS